MNMIPIQVRIPRNFLEKIDKFIETGVYSNRSEAVRDAVRRLIINNSAEARNNEEKRDNRNIFLHL